MNLYKITGRDALMATSEKYGWQPQVGLVRRWEFWVALAACVAFWVLVVLA